MEGDMMHYIPNISQPTIPKYIHNNLPSGYFQ